MWSWAVRVSYHPAMFVCMIEWVASPAAHGPVLMARPRVRRPALAGAPRA